MAILWGIDCRIAIARIQGAISEEPVRCAVCIVSAALRDRIHHAAHGPAASGAVTLGLHLTLLHRVLTDVGADSGSTGVLVVELQRRIVSVLQESVSGRHAAKRHRPKRTVIRYARCEKNEGIDAPAIDR